MAEDNLQSKATDFVKKILTAGVGAIFLTEESLKALVSEFKLPKEFLTQLLESANRTRKEFLENLSQDAINRVISKANPKELLKEILEDYDLELNVKVRFNPRKDSPKE